MNEKELRELEELNNEILKTENETLDMVINNTTNLN